MVPACFFFATKKGSELRGTNSESVFSGGKLNFGTSPGITEIGRKGYSVNGEEPS